MTPKIEPITTNMEKKTAYQIQKPLDTSIVMCVILILGELNIQIKKSCWLVVILVVMFVQVVGHVLE